MHTRTGGSAPSFDWNAGGWFGGQLGCTLWLLILGLVDLPRDALAAWTCIGAFVATNLWGVYLWRGRARLSAYAGIQRLLALLSVVIAAVTVVVHWRGVAEPPSPGALVSTYVPYWVVLLGPALMLVLYFRERK